MSGGLFSELRAFKKDDLATVPTIFTKPSGEKEKYLKGEKVEDETLNSATQQRFIIDAAPDEGLHEVVKGINIKDKIKHYHRDVI